LEGRGFTEQDKAGVQQVVIINESLARKYFSDRSPIDQELLIDKIDPNMQEGTDVAIKRRIIGVVGDVKQNSITDYGITEIYLPLSQNPIRSMYMAIRTNQEVMSLANTAAREIANQRGDVPVSEVIPMERLAGGLIDSTRTGMTLFSFFGLLALCLSAVGVYGLIAYITTLRTREIGIRMAMGAGQQGVFLMICRQAIGFALVGIVIGVIAYFACYRLLSSFLFGITAIDPTSMLIVAILLLLVVLLASLVPALKAARVEPVVALRNE
jgi:putative ABC transport system permease protein